MEQSLLHESLTLLDYEAPNQTTLLENLAEVLRAEGFVKDSFARAIIQREEKFPTGLNTPAVQLAMPHADPQHVERAGILVARLKSPIRFKEMGGSGKDVDARLIFMLAVADPKEHLATLGKLMAIFSDGEKLSDVYQTKSKDELIAKLEKILA